MSRFHRAPFPAAGTSAARRGVGDGTYGAPNTASFAVASRLGLATGRRGDPSRVGGRVPARGDKSHGLCAVGRPPAGRERGLAAAAAEYAAEASALSSALPPSVPTSSDAVRRCRRDGGAVAGGGVPADGSSAAPWRCVPNTSDLSEFGSAECLGTPAGRIAALF